MLHFISLWTSAPSLTCPKPSMYRIWCVWKSPRMVRLVFIKSLSESYSRWCIVRLVWYRFWGPPRQLSIDLGPPLFVIYSSKLLNIIINTCPMYMPMLLILYIWPLNETAAVSSIQSCVHDVQNWMMINRLKLNPDKTEILILGTRQQLEKVIYYFTPCCWWISNKSFNKSEKLGIMVWL